MKKDIITMELEKMLVWTTEKNYIEDFLNRVRTNDYLVIFGAGIGGEKTFEILEKAGLRNKVVAFADNNSNKIGGVHCGIKVISANEIMRMVDDPLIIISSTAYNIIVNQLAEIGIKKERTFYFQPAKLSLDAEDADFIKAHIHDFSVFYNSLEDDKSRKIVINLLNYRISKEQKWLDAMAEYVDDESDQYFDEHILAQYDFFTGFVDGGAYTGDTLEAFVKHFPSWKGTYYCFEADGEICQELFDKVRKTESSQIQVFEYALWNKKERISFDRSIGGSGNCIGEGQDQVQCMPIDLALDGRQVDFIKMDIEGAEHNALLGAERTIKKFLPIMAICVYHKPEDFYDIFMLIKSFSKEYRFYIRQYRYGQTETVLYAVPNSRLK